MQIIGFVFTHMMDFPNSDFSVKTFTAANIFEGLHYITAVKLQLHHWHITEKIHGYPHDFCNQKVGENQDFFPCLGHNSFGFDFYFILKDIRLFIWKMKELNVGGSNLSNLNFVNLSNQVKVIDTIYYY